MQLPLSLAVKDLRHDWQAALCFLAALVGVLAPLLIILALKNGVIGTMVGRLVDDPSNREILAVGAGRYDSGFFDALAARGDIAFAMPATRSINASADAVRHTSNRNLERGVALIPSASGDPLIDGDGQIVAGQAHVSASLAKKIDAQVGDSLEMVIGREIDGRQEVVRQALEILSIVPGDRYGRDAVFISLSDMLAVERFRDDASVSEANWTEDINAPDTYASFRVYVQDLTDLTAVQNWLEGQGATVRPRAENAALLLAFRSNLNILYAIVAALAAVGFWAAMAANLRGMVERQRVSFSLLRLLGLSRSGRYLVPILQSMMLVMGGILATFVLVLPAMGAINGIFVTGPGETVASLGLVDLAGTLILGAVTALTASGWAVWAINGIETEEVLRHA